MSLREIVTIRHTINSKQTITDATSKAWCSGISVTASDLTTGRLDRLILMICRSTKVNNCLARWQGETEHSTGDTPHKTRSGWLLLFVRTAYHRAEKVTVAARLDTTWDEKWEDWSCTLICLMGLSDPVILFAWAYLPMRVSAGCTRKTVVVVMMRPWHK